MARFFSEQDIDEFRDCFYLNCKSGIITDVDQLMFVMRSTGLSPTIDELKGYLKQKKSRISFADFLDCAHSHLKVERVPQEILDAFKCSPWVTATKPGHIALADLKHILCDWGERFSPREADALLRENTTTTTNTNTSTSTRTQIDYKQLVEALVIPRSNSS